MKQKLGLAFPWATITWLSICAKHRRSFWPVPRALGPWRVAGVSVQQESHLLQLPEHTGFMHQVAAPPTVQWRRGPGHQFMALGRSRHQGAVNSWQRCIFKLCSVSPQPHILSILFCHRIFMVGADFALTAVQHSHFTFPPTVKN